MSLLNPTVQGSGEEMLRTKHYTDRYYVRREMMDVKATAYKHRTECPIDQQAKAKTYEATNRLASNMEPGKYADSDWCG